MAGGGGVIADILGWLRGMLTGDLGDTRRGKGNGRIDTRGVAIDEIADGEGPAWGTLSGLTAHRSDPRLLYAVADKDSPPARILEIDAHARPPRVVRQITITTPAEVERLDLEAVSIKRDGGFWLASEGGDFDEPANLLLECDAHGNVTATHRLPLTISHRVMDKGLEGIACVETGGTTRAYAALQGALAGDAINLTRIGALDPASGDWRFWHYPLDTARDGDPTGVSELLHLEGRRFAAIERDGKGGRNSIKWLTTFTLDGDGAPPDEQPPLVTKRIAFDLVPLFLDRDMKVEKEIEGLAVAADGQVYVINDNDSERASLLIRLGHADNVFG